LFGEVVFETHPWEVTYSRKTYLQLLSTYSDHIRVDPETRTRLFADLGDLIDRRFAGLVEKRYHALVVVAPVLPTAGG
jgi:hypothetical protein